MVEWPVASGPGRHPGRIRTLSAIVAVAMAGCSGSTDVIPTGLDTYMVASHEATDSSSGPAQRVKAFEEAREYCEKSGKQLQTIRVIDSRPGSEGKTSSVEVHFRCVTTATPK